MVTVSFWLQREHQREGWSQDPYWGLHGFGPWLLGHRLCPPGASLPKEFEGNSNGSVGEYGPGLGVQRSEGGLSFFGSPTALPWLNVSAEGDTVHLVLDISEEQHFGLSLYWNQDESPTKPWWHRNLVRPPPPHVHSHSRPRPMLRI